MVVGIIIRAYREVVVDMGKKIKSKRKRAPFHKDVPWCYFGGACQGIEGYCGCGIILNLFEQ